MHELELRDVLKDTSTDWAVIRALNASCEGGQLLCQPVGVLNRVPLVEAKREPYIFASAALVDTLSLGDRSFPEPALNLFAVWQSSFGHIKVPDLDADPFCAVQDNAWFVAMRDCSRGQRINLSKHLEIPTFDCLLLFAGIRPAIR